MSRKNLVKPSTEAIVVIGAANLSLGKGIDNANQNETLTLRKIITSGDVQRLKIFLNNVANCDNVRDKLDPYNFSAVHYVGMEGNLEMAKILAKKKFNLNLKEPSSGKTMLHCALEGSHMQLLRFLIGQASVDVGSTIYLKITTSDNRTTYAKGNNLMHIAVARCLKNMLAFLIGDRRTKMLINIRNQMSLTPLELAMAVNDLDCSNILFGHITKNVNVSVNKNGDPLVHWAFKIVDVEFLDSMRFLASPVLDLKIRNRFGQTLVSFLTRLDKIAQIEFILDKVGPEHESEMVNVLDKDGSSALMQAALSGNRDLVQLLVSRGADTNIARTEDGMTALMIACTNGKLTGIVEQLLVNGADVNLQNSAGETCLHLLANSNSQTSTSINIQKADLILEIEDTKLEVETFNQSETPLFYAVRSGNTEFVRCLLQKGADINVCNSQNESILHIAVAHSDSELCDLILENKPHLERRDALQSQTVFHLACRTFVTSKQMAVFETMINQVKNLEKLAKLLQQISAKQSLLDLQDVFGQTALHKAVIAGNGGALNLLLQSEAIVSIKDNVEQTAFEYAVLMGNEVFVEKLLHKCDLTQTNKLNQNVLHLAAIVQSSRIVDLIFNHPDSSKLINSRDQFDRTALHYASEGSQNGAVEVIDLLLQAGFDPEIADQYNERAVQIAERNPNHRVSEILMDRRKIAKQSVGDAFKQGRVKLMRQLVSQLYEGSSNAGSRGGMGTSSSVRTVSQNTPRPDFNLVIDKRSDQKLVEEIGRASNSEGSNPLLSACSHGDIEMLLAIVRPLESNVPVLNRVVSVADRDGNTALHLVVMNSYVVSSDDIQKQQQRHAEVRSYLVNKANMDINIPNCRNETALHLAAANGNLAQFMELHIKGGNPNLRTNQGYNCLHVACQFGKTKIVEYLIEEGTSVNAVSYDNNSALHLCAMFNASEVAQVLINGGIDTEIRNNSEKTAEEVAIEQNHTNFIRTIWQLNATLKGFVGQDEKVTCRKVYKDILKHDSIKAKFPSIIEEYPYLAEQVLDYYLIPTAKDRAMADEGRTVVIDLDLFNSESVESNPLLSMVLNKRGNLLRHPVTKTYMYKKWNQFTVFYYSFTFALYLLAALAYSVYIVDTRPEFQTQTSAQTSESLAPDASVKTISYFVTTFLCFIGLLVEVISLLLLKGLYLKRFSNWIELLFFLIITVYLVFEYCFITAVQQENFTNYVPSDDAWFRMTVLLFCLWLNVGFHTRQNQYFGIYIVMLGGILATFFKLIFPLAFFLVAPALAFYAINPAGSTSFQSPANSVFKALYMVIGNYAGDENVNNIGGWIEAMQSFLALFFIFFVTIVIMNLMTAVAIGDVEAAENSAVETKLEMSANLIIETEYFRRKLIGIESRQNDDFHVQVWDLDETISFGLDRLFQGIWGRPILAKVSILKEIEASYWTNYDLGLAEQEENHNPDMNNDASIKNVQHSFEQELKRHQKAVLREINGIVERDLSVITQKIENLSKSQADVNEMLASNNEVFAKKIAEQANSVGAERQQQLEDKLNSLMKKDKMRRKVQAMNRNLDELRNEFAQIDQQLSTYRGFVQETPLDSLVEFRKQNYQK